MSHTVGHGGHRGAAPDVTANRAPDWSRGADAQGTQIPAPQGPAAQHLPNRPVARPAREAWRQALIVDHVNLVHAVARKVHGRLPRHVELDDLVSAGMVGLIDAADRFEASRAVPFRAFARTRIRGAVVDSLRADDWVPAGVRRRAESLRRTRESLTEKLGVAPDRAQLARAMFMSEARLERMEAGARVLTLTSTEAPIGDDGERTVGSTLASEEDLVEGLASVQQSDAMTAALARLPDRERDAVVLYYMEGQTLEEIGENLGVTLSRAYQLRTRGVERIRYCMQRHLA